MTWIQTYSGVRFDLVNPTVDMIRLDDLAHALSLTCRFAGHTREPYSVARHSIYVAEVLPRSLRLEGLLHDATEAYLGDVTSPLKSQLPRYRDLEWNLEQVLRQKFHLPVHESWEVIEADRRMLVTEARDLFDHDLQWVRADFKDVEPYPGKVLPRVWFVDQTTFREELKRLCPTYLM